MMKRRNIALAVTGAGGTRVAGRALAALVARDDVDHVDLMVSPNGRRLIAHEFGVRDTDDPVTLLLGGPSDKVTAWDPETDFSAPLSSGSSSFWGMVVLPCAMGAAARIAHGGADTLIERAADVCLKQRRPLILCVRETPFNLIHLRNMVQLTEAGAVVYPMIPTYYNAPQSIDQLHDEFVCRLMEFMGLDQSDYYTWQGPDGTSALRDRVGSQSGG
jgi:flavin prenyltransferase